MFFFQENVYPNVFRYQNSLLHNVKNKVIGKNKAYKCLRSNLPLRNQMRKGIKQEVQSMRKYDN